MPMKMTRRRFLWSAAVAGGGLMVGIGSLRISRYIRARRRAPPLGADAWIEIGTNGNIVIVCNATEMGQGSWSALAQLVCEELEADWSRITVSMAPVRSEFYGPSGFGTGGSESVKGMFDMMRRIGAAARQMLIEAAARRWQVPATECAAILGVISHLPTARRLEFGVVAAEAVTLTPPSNPPLKRRDRWSLIGKSLPRLDTPAKVNGSAVYACDMRLPGLRYAAIAHCPVPGGRLRSLATAPAFTVAGVEQVVQLDDAAAVIAANTWSAMQGLKRLELQWELGPHAASGSGEMMRVLHAAIESGQGQLVADDAESRKSAEAAKEAMHRAASQLVATYQAPLLSHAQLEPMNSTAWHHDGGMEIWAPTQQQADLRIDIAKALGMPEERVTVHTPYVGGGFGRRLKNDYGVEAALIAMQSKYPVQVLWSREEDFLRGFFRPAAVARLQAGFDVNGKILALNVHVASLGSKPRLGGLGRQPYLIEAKALHYAGLPSAIRVGSWRSVDMSQNTFFLESFLDECAVHGRRDPLELRLELLKANARERRVLETAAQLAGWRTRASDGRHLGLAFAAGFNSLAALIAETVVTEGRLRIRKIFAVVDCGIAVNPNNIVAQMRGGILMALSAALAEEITVHEGRVQQANYDKYPILRMAQSPELEVKVLETPEATVGGIGEVGVPATAPAVANAVFAATGVRVRSLPMRHDARARWGI